MAYPSLPTERRKALAGLDLGLTIDPGFVHRRRVQTIIRDAGMAIVDDMTKKLPELPTHEFERRLDHIYTQVFLEYCKIRNIPTLEQHLTDREQDLFCSNVTLKPCGNFYDEVRVVSEWNAPLDSAEKVEFQYTTGRVKATTLRDLLYDGGLVSMVATLRGTENSRVQYDPLIMGFPWVTTTDPEWKHYAPWAVLAAYEVFIEDFDEFAFVTKSPLPDSHHPMKYVPEVNLKSAIAQHLGDPVQKDWGGEKSDHFSTNLHLGGQRITGAFLLKGPSHYRPMTVADLGKNGNQIIRLSQEPAGVLIVQHCHDISPDVRTMLQAIAAQPGKPKRYCCVDGRETLRILRALDLYDSVASKR